MDATDHTPPSMRVQSTEWATPDRPKTPRAHTNGRSFMQYRRNRM
jgi:hypothetical protein